MLLSNYLQLTSPNHQLDASFLKEAETNHYKCPTHDYDLTVRKGYKLSPARSVSMMSQEYTSKYPYALCWSRGFEAEKHGPIEPTIIVYCEVCQLEIELEEDSTLSEKMIQPK